ncbi:unnamed protein product [Rotaria sordida]|uniref:Uncharacterized protein n=1 Tax=Rotaria sordida TaxID=392033 RepID=A0A815BG39_9BILA|nr:unnamed protein product [Rotaria sordida]CAF1549539.1 unnamed protein product [Rotaria sordida]
MASYAYRQEPSAPPMYPEVNDIRPVLPVRSELNRHPQEETLLPPRVPVRMDKPTSRSPVDAGLRRDDNEGNTGDTNNDFAYNYNRYATKKTIGHFFMIVALLTSNVMQLRTLILQKQHDSIWIISLVLACISILFQIGLIFILYIIAKGDIRNSQKQIQLERYNNFALIIIIFIAIINVIINIFMLTINSKSFLDTRALEILQNQN